MKTIATIIAALAISASAFAQQSGDLICKTKVAREIITAQTALTALNWSKTQTGFAEPAAQTDVLHLYQRRCDDGSETSPACTPPETIWYLGVTGHRLAADTTALVKGKAVRLNGGNGKKTVHAAKSWVPDDTEDAATTFAKNNTTFSGSIDDVLEIKIHYVSADIALDVVVHTYHDDMAALIAYLQGGGNCVYDGVVP